MKKLAFCELLVKTEKFAFRERRLAELFAFTSCQPLAELLVFRELFDLCRAARLSRAARQTGEANVYKPPDKLKNLEFTSRPAN